ncbi:pleckstrin homology domain-containing family F member 1 [Engraulis encrasicolus]|uniref:pleckstrin homology domain-containing family F member 1 n=1 Tax=Engraulis encrasicolus TaxID=184585 RepID=UPI002FD68A3D
MSFERENRQRIQTVEKYFGASGKPLVKEGRVLVGEGKLLKMSRRGPKPKMFFLFNDVLVYGSIVIPGRLYKRQQVIPLNVVELEDLEDGLGMANQWLLLTPSKSFTVAAVSAEEKGAWMGHINQCISKLDLNGGGKKNKSDLAFAAAWIPDRASAICMRCAERFSVTNRRHHCRRCGFIVCDGCSKGRAVLENISSKPVRVCTLCVSTMEAERGSPDSLAQGKSSGSKKKDHWKRDSVEDKVPTRSHDEEESSDEFEEQEQDESHAPIQWEQDSAWSPYCYFNPDHEKPCSAIA